ncbi:twin transmembrane helix small protein [Faunimonas sp. B44]|uniref:twin transmembrane helix small protein n=1 Tax=Faunimonas sp. B44 TaxID=3461493 RepID=UPI004044213B
MNSLFQVITPIAMAVVVIILLLGLWNMMRGGSANTSQKLMRARVIAQFVAIVLAMTALWFMGR